MSTMNHGLVVLYIILLIHLAGCSSQPRLSFREDVYPILEQNCLACHIPPDGKGYLKTHLNLQSYETLMKGTYYGPVILPGDSLHSILNMLVEGRAEASMRMPHEREDPLTEDEIEVLRLWVDQGAHNN